MFKKYTLSFNKGKAEKLCSTGFVEPIAQSVRGNTHWWNFLENVITFIFSSVTFPLSCSHTNFLAMINKRSHYFWYVGKKTSCQSCSCRHVYWELWGPSLQDSQHLTWGWRLKLWQTKVKLGLEQISLTPFPVLNEPCCSSFCHNLEWQSAWVLKLRVAQQLGHNNSCLTAVTRSLGNPTPKTANHKI